MELLCEWGGISREGGLHFAHAFVDGCIGWESGYFAGGQLQHADVALLEADLGFDGVDLLLGLYCLGFDFLDKL